MVAGGLIGAVGAYIFQAYGGRQLGTEAFAPVAQLWTVFFIIATVLLVPLEQYITREVAGGRKVIPGDLVPAMTVTAIGAVIGGGFVLFTLDRLFAGSFQYRDSDRAPHDRLRIALRRQGRLRRSSPVRQGGMGPDRRDRGPAGGRHRRHPTRRHGGVFGLGDGAWRIRGPRDGLVAIRPGTHPTPGCTGNSLPRWLCRRHRLVASPCWAQPRSPSPSWGETR